MRQFVDTLLCIQLFIVGAAFVSSSLAAPHGDPKNICCPPDTYNFTMFTNTVTVAVKQVTTIRDMSDINIDYKNQRMSIRDYSNPGKISHTIMHPDVTYIISETEKTCILRHDLPLPPKKCLPASKAVTKVGTVKYGDLTTTAYSVVSATTSSEYFLTLTEECIAINLVETTRDSTSTKVTSSLFSDAKEAVDETAFIVPSFCPKA